MHRGRHSGRKRWAVRYETRFFLDAILKRPPAVEYRYFRWRWRAELSRASAERRTYDLLAMTACFPRTTAQILGRITEKN
jgi:hypothetical protein